MAFRKPIMSGILTDWRHRLPHNHPDFRPGYVLVDGYEAFYVDEDGNEFITPEGLQIVLGADGNASQDLDRIRQKHYNTQDKIEAKEFMEECDKVLERRKHATSSKRYAKRRRAGI